MRFRIAAALLLASACHAGDAPNAALEGLKKEVGAYGWRRVESAKSVEVYRIEPDMTKADTKTICGRKVIAQGKDQGEEFTGRLRRALMEGQETPSGKEKECKFQPGVVFRFVNGADHADLILCFQCDELQTVSYPKTAPDAVTGRFDMERSRSAWLELARQALPSDEAIQGLDWKLR